MFVTHGPLEPESPLFIGRQTELARMEKWLSEARYVGAILGARQTGKTSLLIRFRQEQQNKFRCIYIDLEAIHGASVTDCYEYIAEEMLIQLAINESIDLPKDNRQFLKFLQTIAQDSSLVRIGIFLDEIGALPPDTAIKLAHTIRSIFTSRHIHYEYRCFVFTLAGATDMLRLTTGISSPLKNVTDSIYLLDLTPEETIRLLSQGVQSNLSESALEHLYFWTNGHPYLTQLMAHHLHEQGEPISVNMIDETARQLLQVEDRNLPHIFHSLETSESLLWEIIRTLLNGESVPFTRSSTSVAELELLGLVQNSKGLCRIRNHFYEEALRRLLLHQPPFNIARVRLLLTTHFGEEELRTLSFDLQVDYESLPAQGKAGKARELVKHVHASGRLTELIEMCRQLRPFLEF